MTLASLISIPNSPGSVIESFEGYLGKSLEFSESQWDNIFSFLTSIGLSPSTPDDVIIMLWNLLAINGVDSLMMAYTKLVKHG